MGKYSSCQIGASGAKDDGFPVKLKGPGHDPFFRFVGAEDKCVIDYMYLPTLRNSAWLKILRGSITIKYILLHELELRKMLQVDLKTFFPLPT